MRDCRTVWLSVARQCGAAELRLVTWFYLLAVCCRVAHWSFPFLGTPICFSFLRCGIVYLPELFRRVFVCLHYLLSPLACTPVFGHD